MQRDTGGCSFMMCHMLCTCGRGGGWNGYGLIVCWGSSRSAWSRSSTAAAPPPPPPSTLPMPVLPTTTSWQTQKCTCNAGWADVGHIAAVHATSIPSCHTLSLACHTWPTSAHHPTDTNLSVWCFPLFTCKPRRKSVCCPPPPGP